MNLTNPILNRELLDRLRSTKTTAAIVALAIVSSLLVLLRWPSSGTIDVISQGAVQVFRPLAYALALAVMMLVPAFPATSLVNERRRGTLALLLNSPMTPVRIYLGKLVSNVMLSFVLISVTIPALCACLAMGGVSIVDNIGPLLLVLAAMAIQYSALGLWISLRSSSSDGALRWAYAAVLGLAVLTLAPLVLFGSLPGIASMVSQWIATVSPISALQDITGDQSAATALGINSGWPQFLIASLVVTGVFSVLTVRKLDPLLLDRARPVGKVNEAEKGGWRRRLSYLVDPNKRKAGIPRWLNPVMVKEFRTRKFGRLHWLIRLVFACAIISLLLTVVAASGTVNWGVDRIAGPMVLMQVALLLLVGPSLGANLIAAEVESGGWQILRVTPLSAIRILTGKLASVFWTMLLILLATLPGYAVMSFIQPAMSGQVGNVIVSLVVAVFMVISISACVSAFCRATPVATATSYGILLTLFAGTLLVWLARGNPFGPLLVERALMFNPAAAALSEMKTPGFEQYSLTPISWWIGLGISVSCIVVFGLRIWRMTRPD